MRARKRLFMTLVVALNAFCAWAASAAMSAEVGFNDDRAGGAVPTAANGVEGSGRESTISRRTAGTWPSAPTGPTSIRRRRRASRPDVSTSATCGTNETAPGRAGRSGASGAKVRCRLLLALDLRRTGATSRFSSRATNLDPDDSDGTKTASYLPRACRRTRRFLIGPGRWGRQERRGSRGWELLRPRSSADGFFAWPFESRAWNVLDGADTDTRPDVYVRDWSSDLDDPGRRRRRPRRRRAASQATAPSISDNRRGRRIQPPTRAASPAPTSTATGTVFSAPAVRASRPRSPSRATGGSGVKANGFSADPDLCR